jgi:hypothetical protein
MNCGLSAAWPAVSTNAGGRHGIVVVPGGRGVDDDQGQVDLTPLRRFRAQALQQGLEDAGGVRLVNTRGTTVGVGEVTVEKVTQ